MTWINRHLVSGSLLLGAASLYPTTPLAAVEVDQTVVVAVDLIGTKRIHPNKVLGRLHTRPGTPLSESVIADDLARLQSMGYFLRISKTVERVGPGKVKIVFQVEELPYVGEVRFEGVNYFDRKSLQKVIKTKRGQYLNPVQAEVDCKAMIEWLHTKNFLHAQVSHRIELAQDSDIGTVIFEVDMGTKVKVGRLIFNGMPAGAHRFFLQPLLFNPQGRFFQEDMVSFDRATVQQYVQDQGYLDATVEEPIVEYFDQVKAYEPHGRTGPELVPDNRTRDRVVINYTINAGERWRLRNVRFIGNTVYSEEELREAFALPAGHLFIRKDIDEAKREALGLLRNNGYARAFFAENPVYDSETKEVDLNLYLREGDVYTVGRIDVFGNTITKDAVVRRALQLEPGQIWRDKDRDRSRRGILRSGVFRNDPLSPVRIRPDFNNTRPNPIDPTKTEADVTVDVDEDKTGRFSFNIGFSSAQGIIGRVEFAERNFDLWGLITGTGWRGAAHRLSAAASWSDERTSLRLSWRNPRVMDSLYSVGTTFFRTDSSALDWDELRLGGNVSVGRRITLAEGLEDDLELTIGYGLYQLEVDEVDVDANDDALDGEGTYLNHFLTASQEFDLLDNRVYPTSGILLEANERLTGGFLPADDEFTSVELKGTFYIPLHYSELGGATMIRIRQSNRWLNAIGDSEQVPFYDRLYGGGPAPRHRGFERFDLGPFETNRNGFEARVGGTTEWLTTAEFIVPIQGTNQGLRTVLFTDVGQIWAQEDEADLGELRTAVGFGLRFPQAIPIALDFAWLLDAEDGEDQTQFHFSLAGFAF